MAEAHTQDWWYTPASGHWDEYQSPSGQVRPHWDKFAQSLHEMGRREFDRRWQSGQQIIRQNAITYNIYGDARGGERLWPLDPVPLIIDADEWAGLEAGIAQRAVLLNALLNDCYGPQTLIGDRHLPSELLFANSNFLRPCHGIRVPGDMRLHFYAVDLARSKDGRWWVVADRTQVPSGGGYALENRLVSARTLPGIFSQYTVRPLNHFFTAHRNGLLSLAGGEGRMVLLTPGPYNETYFEHSYLAKTFAIPLVEGPDLTVRANRVYLKTLEGLEPVDLILRRQDDDYCDPLELRGDSLLGVPGLLNAVRAGTVVVANSLGSGLIETAMHMAFLPSLSNRLLGEDLLIPSVATWWCGQKRERDYVLKNLSGLVIKPAFPGFGRHPVFGAHLSEQAKLELCKEIEARPQSYVAQELISLSEAPIWTEDGLSPRHVMLRAYAAWDGSKFTVMPGGLTRVSHSPTSLVVSMQQGGGSKDTWILGLPQPTVPVQLVDLSAPVHAASHIPSRIADNLFWLGRYTERVESIIRLLRGVLPALSGEEDFGHSASLDAVLKVLTGYGFLPATVLQETMAEQLHHLESLLTQMTHDPAGISALGFNLKQIRRAAWPLKERLSSDTWRVLQQLELDSLSPANPYLAKRPAALLLHLDRAITALSAFVGLLSDSTTRGHGWRFLEIGRRLERALQMSDLLRHGMPIPALELVLQVADSSITYRTRHLTVYRASYVLDLLVRDEANPRSIAFQAASLVELTTRLPNQDIESRLAIELCDKVRAANTELLAKDVAKDAAKGGLTDFLGSVRTNLFDLSEALTGKYLTHVIPSRLNSA